jgi:hypothetical protein
MIQQHRFRRNLLHERAGGREKRSPLLPRVARRARRGTHEDEDRFRAAAGHPPDCEALAARVRLSGKYRRGAPLGRRGRAARRGTDLADHRGAGSGRRGERPAPLARCAQQAAAQERPVVPDHGARTVEQLQENVGALGWTLSAEEIERLDRVSAVPEPSPYSFINGYTRKDSSPSSSGDA